MSHTTVDGTTGDSQQAHMQNVQATQMSGWVGWIAFASIMMVMLGTFHAIQGLVAIFRDEYFLVGPNGMSLNLDFTAWGWVHLLGGIVVIAAGLGVLTGKMWARSVAVLLALASSILNIGFLAAYPIWSVTMIAVDILVIWALTVHGHEMRR